jgi:choline dehydrogenase
MVKELVAPSQRVMESDEALGDWIHQNVATAFHSSGTCKMGPESDPTSVVDQYCRVHGLEHLRVVDLSVAPDVVRANTNATAIMIAERASGWIG